MLGINKRIIQCRYKKFQDKNFSLADDKHSGEIVNGQIPIIIKDN